MGFAYLCVIMDLSSHKIISYRVHHNMNFSFVVQTLQIALNKRKPVGPLLFHFDRGSQFTCFAFRKLCDAMNITQSFSKKAYPWDNSVMESFFKYAKQEEFSRHSFADVSQVKLAAFSYIDGFYNSIRPHSANHMLSPDLVESSFSKNY